MVLVSAYHRPPSAAEALALLTRTGVRSAILAGGTALNPSLTDAPGRTTAAVEVIDLQQAGLSGISVHGAALTIGATTTLADVFMSTHVTEGLRDLARRELPSTLRSLATVGGTIAERHSESEFTAGLLALGATVEMLDASGARRASLADVLSDADSLAGAIITSIAFPAGGMTVSAHTARTPMDTAIVAVVGHRTAAGEVTLAATGIAPTPVTIVAGQPLGPPGDFRGSSRYRTALLRTLAARVAALLGN
jgi:aerobic carbon-monoxide dehydrogenase medium subunit